ncbi:RING/U-box superfamily protein [Striga hermonthica]|uniref:RING-type E3 ubiquitin transferase n=1 Tax=Striga hermonthica TaxID=68872 RepID=A0A9N7N1S0_STRHE|nr:RING/U-box superfamily protein [Striga hermonthica]
MFSYSSSIISINRNNCENLTYYVNGIIIDKSNILHYVHTGLSRGAKYGIIVGVGIPGLVCIIGLACYACGIVRASTLRRQLNSDLPNTFSDQWPTIRSVNGLDRPTIESYPTTILGESRRLPKPSDGTCPICLSDYQPKETIRSIPECNHYFHAECIDEWLKLNRSCPLCRKSPESTSPCSSSPSILVHPQI